MYDILKVIYKTVYLKIIFESLLFNNKLQETNINKYDMGISTLSKYKFLSHEIFIIICRSNKYLNKNRIEI